MKQLLSIIAVLCFVSHSFSQTMKEDYANKLSKSLKFSEAYPVWAEMAKKSLKKNQNNWTYMKKAVEAAYNAEKYDKALYWSEMLTANPDLDVSDWEKYFQLLMINSKHDRLIGAIDSALMRKPNDEMILNWKKQAPIILRQLNEISEYSISNYREMKKGEEFCAVPYKEQMIIVSNRRNTGFVNRNYSWTGQHFLDLVTITDSTKLNKDKIWKEIKRTNPHDGPIAFSADYKTALLTVNHVELDPSDGIRKSKLQLKIYRNKDGKWVEGEAFPYNDKVYSVGHGVFDLQGNIIFASDKPGGMGGSDLYKSSWKDGAWSEPVNLGKSVNSRGNELFPFVSNNGTLYFSSNGWPGNGGLDVFYQEKADANPKHIGNPINTNADDFGIYVDENTGRGLLSSNRNNFRDQIYRISKPVYKIEAEITLVSCDNKPLDKRQIVVKNTKTLTEEIVTTDAKGKISMKPSMNSNYTFSFVGDTQLDAVMAEKTFDKEGKIQVALSAKYKKKSLKLKIVDENGKNLVGAQLTYYTKGTSGKKFLTTDQPIEVSVEEMATVDSIVGVMINYKDCKIVMKDINQCSPDLTANMNFIKVDLSNVIDLKNIYYDFDLWNIRPEGKIELDKLVKYMKEHPSLPVELGSHTDCRGTDAYNVWLAEKRSQSCVNYIKSKGIPADKIIAKGYGEKQLVNECADGVKCSEEKHQLNRRTTLKIDLNK
jgi:outer membrane protein OmpA-like peptidoglycan-associated protein